jgi:cytochrome c biogenesis protein CcdA
MDAAAWAATMLLAGLATALSPCVAPVIPAYLAYAARRRGVAAPLAFSLSLAAGLLAYARVATWIGAAALIPLSPQDAAALLSFALIALAAFQASPGGRLGTLLPRPKRIPVGTAGAALAGLGFSLLAAPCASGPVLALAAVAALDPGAATAAALSFAVGVFLPYAVLGVAAARAGGRVPRTGRVGEVLAPAVLAAAGIASLLSGGDAASGRVLPAARLAASAVFLASAAVRLARGGGWEVAAAAVSEVAGTLAPGLWTAAAGVQAGAATSLARRGRAGEALAVAAQATGRLPSPAWLGLAAASVAAGLAPTLAEEGILGGRG